VLSTLSKEIQKETGIGPIPVTTGASHDTAAAFLTVDGDETNAVLISGTWSILGVHTDRQVFFRSVDPERYGYEGNPDGTLRFLCNIPGMWILEQCRSVWKKQGISSSYGFLTAGAKESTHFNSVIDPYHPDFSYPEDMTAAIKNYCIETGQAVPRTPAEFSRAIILGLAFAYTKAVRELEEITKRKIKRIDIIGGGSRNLFLNQLIAEKTGVEVIRGWVEATTIGNLLNQRLALQNNAH
jgi:rhamnulokinase